MAELMVNLNKEEDIYNTFSQLFNLSHDLSGRATAVMLLGFEPNPIALSLVNHLHDNGFGDIWFVTNLGCGCQGNDGKCFCSEIKKKIGIPDKSIIFNQEQMSRLNFANFQGIVVKNKQHPQYS
ncbi:MAG TPA: hypothetical protein PKN62_03250 [bacterium]|nr:hypothetical protein [bacterium]